MSTTAQESEAGLGTLPVPGPLRLRGITIDPPLLNASGAFDVVAADPDWSAHPASAAPLGAYVTKTVTVEARAGNPQPWVEQLAEDTLVNSVGLANPGIAAFAEEWHEAMTALGVPVLLSLGGDPEELVAMIDIAEDVAWVAGYELNLSCPNVHGGAALAAGDPERVLEAVSRARARTARPVLAKLSAASSDIAASARAAEAGGADAITAVNTMPVRALDDDGVPLLGSVDGGMSGAMLHPIALRAVAQVAGAVSIPVIGLGGVGTRAGARRMFACGASAVAVGTAAAIAPVVLADVATLFKS